MKRMWIWICSSLLALAIIAACIHVKGLGPEPLGMDYVLKGSGLKDKVKIVRDENYLPHIIGSNDEDIYFGLGFAMAQDRISQLDILRKTAQGRLGEIMGKSPSYKGLNIAEFDVIFKSFRYSEDADAGYKALKPEYRRLLDSFSNGINRYIREVGNRLPFEAATMGVETVPWKPQDSFTIMGLFGLSMTFDALFNEYYMDRIAAKLGPEKMKIFLPQYPSFAPTITAQNHDGDFIRPMSALKLFLDENVSHPIGSNNWAVGASRSANGHAMLANDPHVPLPNIPTFWYHCHLQGGSFDAMGMMFPGFPAFGAASNGKISWGLTNAQADYIDTYREKVNPENPNQYLYKGKWEEFKVVTGELKIKGEKKTVPYSYRMTRHGSVIENGMVGDYKIRKWAPGEVMAVKFVDVDLATFFSGYVDIAKTQNWTEFREACSRIAHGYVAWNHVYADIDGNIGYQTTGPVPIRADNQGYTIHDGATGEGDWIGYVPFEKLPSVFNPSKGYVLSANNRIVPDDYPYYIAHFYFPYRATRINEFLAAREKVTVEDFMALHADTVDIPARNAVPYMIEDLESSGDAKMKLAAAILKQWQGQEYRADIDKVGPSIFHAFMIYFPHEIFADEFGKEMTRPIVDRYSYLTTPVALRLMADPKDAWFDDLTTPAVETRRDITLRSMEQALKWLEKLMGKDMTKWEWGKIHRIKFGSAINLFPPPYTQGGEVLIRGPYPHPGTDDTVNLGAGIALSDGFRVVAGPSSRLIVDFSHPDWIFTIASTGMSSNPTMPNYDNLMDKWRKCEYVRMDFKPENYSKNARGTISIEP